MVKSGGRCAQVTSVEVNADQKHEQHEENWLNVFNASRLGFARTGTPPPVARRDRSSDGPSINPSTAISRDHAR